MNRKLFGLTVALGIFLAYSGLAQAQTVIKLGTIAPKGTGLEKNLSAAAKEVAEKTQGRVKIKIYAGGTFGDEPDMVRKIRIGQLHSAAFTGMGLGMIESEVRVLELPFLFDNQAEIDSTYKAMKPYFDQKFDAKGFKLLAWAEVGYVQIFSRDTPIKSKQDLQGKKMWMWEGDPLAQAMYETLGVVPVPLAITDVLTSLQTGVIDGAYSTPLGAIAFQWHTKAKYMSKINLTNATGAIVVSKKAWAKLSPQDQGIIEKIFQDRSSKLTAQSRDDNEKSLQSLKALNINVVELDPQAKAELESISKDVQQKLVGKLYPKSLLDKVLGLTQ